MSKQSSPTQRTKSPELFWWECKFISLHTVLKQLSINENTTTCTLSESPQNELKSITSFLSKITNDFWPGQKWGTFLRIYRLWPVASSDLNYFFQKCWKNVFMVLSLFAHFWRQFLSDFNVWPFILKLMTSSTSIWSNFTIRGPIRHLKTAQHIQKLPMLAILRHVLPF